MTTLSPDTTKLLEAFEAKPKHVLCRVIRKHTSPDALLAALNEAQRRMQDGLAATWGRLEYSEIVGVAMILEERLQTLERRRVDAHIKQHDLIQQRPYLSESLKGLYPRGKTENSETSRSRRSERNVRSGRRTSRRDAE